MEWSVEQLSSSLARIITRFEEEELGARPSRVTVTVEGDLVVVHLLEVLSPSERALARTEAGQAMLQRFNTLLFNSDSSPSAMEQVAQVFRCEVVEVQTSLSALSGSLVVVFALGEGPHQ